MKKLLIGLGVFSGLAIIGKVVEMAEKKEAKRLAMEHSFVVEDLESARARINDLELGMHDLDEDLQCEHAVKTGVVPVRYEKDHTPVYLVENTTGKPYTPEEEDIVECSECGQKPCKCNEIW
jgi:hypothetical protein